MEILTQTELLEEKFLDFIRTEMTLDLAHDINHVLRVVKTAKSLCREEGACMQVVLPAAYLHDCFSYDKSHPERHQSSSIAADKAVSFLSAIAYPAKYLDPVHHAIVAHSFSAKVKAETLEAQIVQDADRLDSLGAIGIARCLQVSSVLNRPLYADDDPFCTDREPDDGRFAVDHFYTKLLRIQDMMNTQSGIREAKKRTSFMLAYLKQLELEV